MKISTNAIGNYAPQLKNNAVNHSKLNESAAKLETKSTGQAKKANLTSDEKNFFKGLYPEKASDVVDYHFYKKSGEMSGVKIGSLFDKRG